MVLSSSNYYSTLVVISCFGFKLELKIRLGDRCDLDERYELRDGDLERDGDLNLFGLFALLYCLLFELDVIA